MEFKEIMDVYDDLLIQVGPRNWWPADTPFEVIIGAILTQNTSWKNVEKAIVNLKKQNLLSPKAIYKISEEKLADVIRPSGYYNQKAKKIKEFVKYFYEQYDGSINKMREERTSSLRSELLGIHGIGPETADAILLYALGKPIFVVDTYTKRILQRHKWINEKATYQEIQDLFMKRLPRNTQLFNEYHALIDFVGHNYCRKQPKCHGCPLEKRLPQMKESL